MRQIHKVIRVCRKTNRCYCRQEVVTIWKNTGTQVAKVWVAKECKYLIKALDSQHRNNQCWYVQEEKVLEEIAGMTFWFFLKAQVVRWWVYDCWHNNEVDQNDKHVTYLRIQHSAIECFIILCSNAAATTCQDLLLLQNSKQWSWSNECHNNDENKQVNEERTQVVASSWNKEVFPYDVWMHWSIFNGPIWNV